ncbi:MAG: hypothetical protein AB1405_09005 [Bdellovibrionota bacterium]
MAELPSIYEEYLSTLDSSETHASRQALEDWHRFLEGRQPGEVDGSRREWFELTREETGLPAAEVKSRSERVGRFYSWLSAARPEALRKNSAQPKPAPTRDSSLPPPPPDLAKEENLFKQGPSLGPPPFAGPKDGTGREWLKKKPPAAQPKITRPAKKASSFLVGGGILFLAASVLLAYIFLWSPPTALESDVELYLQSANGQQMTAFYEWLSPKALAAGFEIDRAGVRLELKPLAGASKDFQEIRLEIPAVQNVFGWKRRVTLKARAPSIHRPPEGFEPPAAAAPEEIPAETPAVVYSPEDARLLREGIEQIRTSLNNYRRLVSTAQGPASKLLETDITQVMARIDSAAASRARDVLLGAAGELLDIAKNPPELKLLENRLFEVERALREAERQLP